MVPDAAALHLKFEQCYWKQMICCIIGSSQQCLIWFLLPGYLSVHLTYLVILHAAPRQRHWNVKWPFSQQSVICCMSSLCQKWPTNTRNHDTLICVSVLTPVSTAMNNVGLLFVSCRSKDAVLPRSHIPRQSCFHSNQIIARLGRSFYKGEKSKAWHEQEVIVYLLTNDEPCNTKWIASPSPSPNNMWCSSVAGMWWSAHKPVQWRPGLQAGDTGWGVPRPVPPAFPVCHQLPAPATEPCQVLTRRCRGEQHWRHV